MKQSAVEWTWQQLLSLHAARQLGIYNPEEVINKQIEILNKAKQMEKECITKAWDDGWLECTTSDQSIIDAEEYYEQTYERNIA